MYDDDDFDEAHKRYRRGDPNTSQWAAESVNLPKRQGQVISVFYSDVTRSTSGRGWIGFEVDVKADYRGLWRRMKELRIKGFLERRIDPNTGDWMKRESRESGKMQDIHWMRDPKLPPQEEDLSENPREPDLFSGTIITKKLPWGD